MNSKYLYRDQSGEAGTAAEFARSALVARNDRSIARGDLLKSGPPGGSSRRAIPHAVADPSSSAFLLNADLAQKRMVTLEKSAPKPTFSTLSCVCGQPDLRMWGTLNQALAGDREVRFLGTILI